jgi:hypothetical protein
LEREASVAVEKVKLDKILKAIVVALVAMKLFLDAGIEKKISAVDSLEVYVEALSGCTLILRDLAGETPLNSVKSISLLITGIVDAIIM